MNAMLRRTATTLAALSLAFGVTTAVSGPADAKLWKVPATSTSNDPMTDLNEYETRLINQINKFRAKHDRRQVQYFQTCADGMSERWSKHLKTIDSLVHRDQYYVLDECNFTWTGEVLVSGTGLRPYQAVRAWLNSPGHRAVIMKPRATRVGAGVRVQSDGTVFAVLNFGDSD
ncbi:CAP domain-containing protein [Nocardioides taihuensis]|uniref:CAP domain-containing protein n=1 Tax=Nocardioides taihuensis TaxID=1835606 RepID=A0ABW0BI59_9ACTN